MYSVQVSIMRDLVYGAVAHGASLNALCQRMGITPQQLNDSENHLPWEQASNFWGAAVEMTRDEQLGLHIGQQLTPTAFGILGFLMQSSKTLEEACLAAVQFNNTLTGVFKYDVELTDTMGYLLFEPTALYEGRDAESARQAVEVSVSSYTMHLQKLTGKKIHPVSIELTYDKRNPQEYERVLKAPVKFNAARNCIALRREDLQTPIISYDKSLYALFSTLLQEKQKAMFSQETYAEKIRSLLLHHFNGQAPALEIVAAQLATTTRTLQRKLTEEGTSYRGICNQLRKELSMEMLRHKLKKEEIANLLGYADGSTLRRQYKQWDMVVQQA